MSDKPSSIPQAVGQEAEVKVPTPKPPAPQPQVNTRGWPGEKPSSTPPPSSDRAAIGCLVIAAGLVLLALFTLIKTSGSWADDVARALNPPTPTPIVFTPDMSDPTATPEPEACATVEESTCPAWRDSEKDLIETYRAEAVPLAGDLLSIAANYESISRAFEADRKASLNDATWSALIRSTSDSLWLAQESIAGMGIPGSIAGTHTRLVIAAMLLGRCEWDTAFWRGANISGSRIDMVRGPLGCIDSVAAAREQILWVISDLGGGV